MLNLLGNVPLQAAGAGRDRRRLLILALLPLLLLTSIWRATAGDEAAGGVTTLAGGRLIGPRGPACIRLVVAEDVSGSMAAFSTARDRAISQFLSWAPTNLRADDEIGVISFAGTASWRIPPVRVGKPPKIVAAAGLGNGTNFRPVVRLAGNSATGPCEIHLVMLSDAQVADIPASAGGARTLLQDAGITEIYLLVPGENVDVFPGWEVVYPAAPPKRFDGMDADTTGVEFAKVVAKATGQSLDAVTG